MYLFPHAVSETVGLLMFQHLGESWTFQGRGQQAQGWTRVKPCHVAWAVPTVTLRLLDPTSQPPHLQLSKGNFL